MSSITIESGERQVGADVPTVSVVICAHTMQRWPALCAAVTSANAQSRHPRSVVVVIDHCEPLLRRSAAQFAPLGVIVVGNAHEKGLSGARNTGIEHAHADVVAFLDDDATARPDWIEQLCRAYAPGVLGVGGSATPVWPTTRPKWFPPPFDWVVGCSYTGQLGTNSAVRNFLGCNMSFRREVFHHGRRFSSELGRNGSRPMGCEETELCIRLLADFTDGRLILRPEANVLHHVSADRTRTSYFRRRCFAEGLSKASVSDRVGRGPGLQSERQYVTRTLPGAVLNGLRHAATDPWGLARSTMILVGLIVTTAGYLTGTMKNAIARSPAT